MLIRTLAGTYTLRRSRNNAADALQARVDDLHAPDSTGSDSQGASAPEATLKFTPSTPTSHGSVMEQERNVLHGSR
jgi:hypothetical protein